MCSSMHGALRQNRMIVTELNNQSSNAAAATIEINLTRLAQLFNTFDPSPFHERDLNKDAEEYIIGSAEEITHHQLLSLVVHLPADHVPDARAPSMADAIHNYFAYREMQERRRLRLLFRDGRIALIIGLGFLFCCVLLRELTFSLGHDATVCDTCQIGLQS